MPFLARLVEIALREVDNGLIDPAEAMAASTAQTIVHILLPEARPALVAAGTVTAIALLDYTAMAGVIGGGGLGELAIRYGYQRFQTDVMVVTVALRSCWCRRCSSPATGWCCATRAGADGGRRTAPMGPPE